MPTAILLFGNASWNPTPIATHWARVRQQAALFVTVWRHS